MAEMNGGSHYACDTGYSAQALVQIGCKYNLRPKTDIHVRAVSTN